MQYSKFIKLKYFIVPFILLICLPAYSIKIISLNIWGGHVKKPLIEFIKSQKGEVDIFFLQEVYNNAPKKISADENEVSLNIFQELQELLPEYTGVFQPVVGSEYGIAAFVKNGVNIVDKGVISIHENPDYPGLGPTHSRKMQWLKCKVGDQVFCAMNVHGLWNGMGKTDTPPRLAQSKKIKDFIDNLQEPKILCGDFNLRPDTESIRILENSSLRNLISTCNITSTRTSLYTKDEKYADYIFISPEVKVNKFTVLPDVVSDHSPLLLDWTF